MSNYNARRAPNVSQYLANLNAVPTAQDLAAQNDFTVDTEGLDFLTTAEFFDFDNDNFDPAGDFGAAAPAKEAPQSAGPNGTWTSRLS